MSRPELNAVIRRTAGRAMRLISTALLLAAAAAAATAAAQSGTAAGRAGSNGNSGAIAQNVGNRATDQAGRADPQAGSRIAANGAPGGAAACMGCHGANGEGNAAAGFPALAGQSAAYLERQMRSFANGERSNPVMTPIAKALKAQQQRDVSAWYGTLAVAAGTAASGAKAGVGAGAAPTAGLARQIEQGRLLATQGDPQRRVQACANCHGPGGVGEAPTYPALAGQPASYFTAAMDEWKSGTRKTDPSGQMPMIAKQLADGQVAALAAYFSSLPRSGFAQEANIPAGSSMKPAIAASANGSGPPPQTSAAAQGDGGRGNDGKVPAAGTEQGAPVTGGNQGPGGGGGTQAGNPSQPGTGTAPPAQQTSPRTPPRQAQEKKK